MSRYPSTTESSQDSDLKKEPTGPLSTWQPAILHAALATSPLLLLVASLVGCGGPKADRLPVHPVKGQVTLQGKPLANALVVLHPKAAKSPGPFSARGQTDESGNFQVTTYDTNDGAPAGEYAVTVQAYQLIQKGESYEPGPNILSPKLSKPETTDISVRVAEGPNNLTPIEVTR